MDTLILVFIISFLTSLLLTIVIPRFLRKLKLKNITKILLMGPPNSGKTCLINKIKFNSFFQTINISSGPRRIDHEVKNRSIEFYENPESFTGGYNIIIFMTPINYSDEDIPSINQLITLVKNNNFSDLKVFINIGKRDESFTLGRVRKAKLNFQKKSAEIFDRLTFIETSSKLDTSNEILNKIGISVN